MTNNLGQENNERVGHLNELVAQIALLEQPGKIRVEVKVPSYISYAHFQNLALAGRRHGVFVAAQILAPASNGEFTLKIVPTSQGQNIGKEIFVTLKDSATEESIQAIRYDLDGNFLLEVREATPASFELTLMDGADEVARTAIAVELFPPNLWSYKDQGELMLTTFVRPRDPSLDGLLTEARRIKGTYKDSNGRNYEPNTAGHQSGDDEVFAEVKAMYQAVQNSGIHYSNPAGSEDWTIGQLIRSTNEILQAKAATCLDSTVLFASMLENIGLMPVMALVPGHAFVGYWTTTGVKSVGSFQDVVVNGEEALQLVRLQFPALRFVETTRMCLSSDMTPFEEAVKLAEGTLGGSLNRADMKPHQIDDWKVIDVASARRRGYRPMAAKIKLADGTSSIIEFSIDQTPVSLSIQVDEAKLGSSKDTSPPRVKYWKSQLLDLTFNNPLLSSKRRAASQVKILVPEGRLGSIEDFLQQPKSELRLVPGLMPDGDGARILDSAADGSMSSVFNPFLDSLLLDNKSIAFACPKPYEKESSERYIKRSFSKIRNLARSSKSSQEETGINNLYMTFGSLKWLKKDASVGSKDGYVTSPLILLPVTLRAIDRGRSWVIALDETGEVSTNETLALKLFSEHGISIPALTAPEDDAAGIDIPALINAVKKAVVEAKHSTWFVSEAATIGTFDFSTFHIWKDLNDNWEKLSKSTLVKHLIETDGTDAYQDPEASDVEITEEELDAELAKVPVASDGTQLKAIVRSLRGESFVIQGPPGTGKSQTITNLLARNLQAGRKVLFMSEKPAALQVVKDRLDEINLGSFVLDLHSKNTSPAEIRRQILTALDVNPTMDSVGIGTANFDFEVATKALSKYPERLHRIHPVYQESVYSVRDTLLSLPETNSMSLSKSALAYFDAEKLMAFKSDLQNLPDVGDQAGTARTNTWSFSNLSGDSVTSELRMTLSELLRELIPSVQAMLSKPSASRVLDSIRSLPDIKTLSKTSANLPSIAELKQLGALESKQRLQIHREYLVLLSSKIGSPSIAADKFGSIPIAALEQELKSANEAKLFKKRKLETLAAKFAIFWTQEVSESNVGQFIALARELIDLGAKAADSSLGIPGVSPIVADAVFIAGTTDARLSHLTELEEAAASLSNSEQTVMETMLELSPEDRGSVSLCLSGIRKLMELSKASDESVSLWFLNGTLSDRLSSVISKWESELIDSGFRELIRWGNQLDLLAHLRSAGQEAAIVEILSGEISPDESPRSFERAYLELLLEKLIDDHELGNFDSASQGANVTKLRKSTDSLRIFNRDTIGSAVVQSRTFDPKSVAGRAGGLRSEINKQRGQLPIRQLMKKYWDTITEITPCVAASPDSVARFLDVDLAHFDLVVFDEASQLRVPNSIGALGRGKSAIIVGDSKQMPPTMLFASSQEDEDEESSSMTQPDVESILTMAEYSKMPSVMLKWHYRSQDESLIAFSNAEYYQDQLASFPSPREGGKGNQAIEFEFVENGRYLRKVAAITKPVSNVDDPDLDEEIAAELSEAVLESEKNAADSGDNIVNSNANEAAAVVAKVLELYKIHGTKLNLGIVTMNEQQNKSISRKLEAAADDDLRKLMDSKTTRDHLFVRALEKVQGDERDIIIMSIGFARVPDARSGTGYSVPQNFGPLTKAGSERRLNVAVTRARQQIIVFCSFQPEDLRIGPDSSLGMSGLHSYLRLAKYGAHEVGLGNKSSFTAPDRHRIDIAKAIEDMGYKTKQGVGLSTFKVDIAVENPGAPGEYLLGILLDGPGWRGRPTTSDRDVLPLGVLQKNMGWGAIERVWLPVWLKDREGQIQRLQSKIAELVSTPKKIESDEVDIEDLPDLDSILATSQVSAVSLAYIEPEKGVVGVNIDDIEPWTEVSVRLVTDDKSFLQHTTNPEIKRVIGEIVKTLTSIEGPVHPDRAVSFIARSFGLSHVQTARSQEVLIAIPRSRFTRDDEGFIFPDGVSISDYKTWKRKTFGAAREIAGISLAEIGNAMRSLCDKTHGLESEELLRQTMLSFGVKTLSAPVRARLESAVAFAVQRGIIKLKGDHFEAS